MGIAMIGVLAVKKKVSRAIARKGHCVKAFVLHLVLDTCKGGKVELKQGGWMLKKRAAHESLRA